MSSLFEEFYEDCVMMVHSFTSDSEGGQTASWAENMTEPSGNQQPQRITFKAAIVHNSSIVEMNAGKDTLDVTYKVTTDKNHILNCFDVFKRIRDGKLFRVTSNGSDILTPSNASFSFSQVTAEEWRLPT